MYIKLLIKLINVRIFAPKKVAEISITSQMLFDMANAFGVAYNKEIAALGKAKDIDKVLLAKRPNLFIVVRHQLEGAAQALRQYEIINELPHE